jgi:hypothetical protein
MAIFQNKLKDDVLHSLFDLGCSSLYFHCFDDHPLNRLLDSSFGYFASNASVGARDYHSSCSLLP